MHLRVTLIVEIPMRTMRVFMRSTLLLFGCNVFAAAQPQQAPVATLHVDSRLVFLDTTVLDKHGNIITTGLTQDDFVITEDKQPRHIFSFEPPEEHLSAAANEAPSTIFVVDQLNGSMQDLSFIRHSLRQYLDKQPPELDSPCELMLLGPHSLQMVQSFTHSKDELLSALDQISQAFFITTAAERFNESIYALQLIALQNQGVPGRKNIVWLGYGGPSTDPPFALGGNTVIAINRFLHRTTNMMVDARISLFLIYPGIAAYQGTGISSPTPADNAQTAATSRTLGRLSPNPFDGEIRFGSFATATGGSIFWRNNVDTQIDRARELGADYYTLTYQPQQDLVDGKFRNIRITMRNHDLHAITKTGYFASDKKDTADPRLHLMENLIASVRSTVPLHGLPVSIADIHWRPDTGTAQFTVAIDKHNLRWQTQDDGKSTTHLFFAVASLKGPGNVLTSAYEPVTLTVPTQDITSPTRSIAHMPVVFHVAPKTANVRFVIETEDGDKLGSAEIPRAVLDAVPQTPTPTPVLTSRPTR
jgi:VWFA-related protein